jgi:hypothetical protein
MALLIVVLIVAIPCVAAILAHTDAAAGPVAPPTRDWRRAGGAG